MAPMAKREQPMTNNKIYLLISALTLSFSVSSLSAASQCPRDPAVMAQALLNAAVSGAPSSPAACQRPADHPYVRLATRSESLNGTEAPRIPVDDNKSYGPIKVALGQGGAYLATFYWKAGRTTKPDSIVFYLDPERANGSCALMVKPPEIRVTRKSCAPRGPR